MTTEKIYGRRVGRPRKKRPAASDPMMDGRSLPVVNDDDLSLRTFKHDDTRGPNTIKADEAFRRWAPDFSVPSVAQYAARVLIGSVMDYRVAAVKLIPVGTMPDEKQLARLVRALKESSEVQKELESLLQAQGLDEQSKSSFVREMWAWLMGEDGRLKRQAAMILGRGFIGEKVLVDKPEELPIQGFDEGITSLLGPAPGKMVPLPPTEEIERRSLDVTAPGSGGRGKVSLERREHSRTGPVEKIANVTHQVIRELAPNLTSHPDTRHNNPQELDGDDVTIQ